MGEPPPLPASPQHALSPPHHPALLPSLLTALELPLLLASPQHALSPPHPPALPLSLKDAPIRLRPHARVTAPGLMEPVVTSQLLPKTALEPPPLPASPQHALSPPHPPALPLSLKDAPERPRPHALVTAPGLIMPAETSQLWPKTALEP